MKRSPLRKVSLKKQRRNRKKFEAYDKVDIEWDGICTGCNKPKSCSHSHLIPVSEDIRFEDDPENITHHCDTCHPEWESHNIERMKKLLDFEKNMSYIKKVKPSYYNRLYA